MDLALSSLDDEELLLDLLNTTPVIDGSPTDTLADHRAAAPWLTEHGLSTSREECQTLLRARAILQAIVRGEETASALQPILAAAELLPTATDTGVRWQLTGAGGAVRAALAWDSLRITSPGRLRPCANAECHLFLIDRSKPNTARWCSMAVCGNRMKARRHHSRNRAG